MKRIIFLLSIFFLSVSFAFSNEESFFNYQFGRGLKIKHLPFRIGGYLSIKYQWSNHDEFEFNFENLALLMYGDITKRTSIFFELEARDLYVKKREIEYEDEEDYEDEDDYEEEHEHQEIEIEIEREFVINPEIERIYVDYFFSDSLRIRLGKFITPIGLWNPIHIPPLKWTSIDPPIATDFFPRFTTGIRIYGLLPFQQESWEYSIFLQKTRGIDDRNNNVKTDNFIGTEVRKTFSNFSLSVSLGKFNELRINKNIKFFGVHIDYYKRRFRFMSEVMYGVEEQQKTAKKGYYIQGIYRVFSKNYLIIRNDYLDNKKYHKSIKGLLVGWNYRPLFPLSLKIEFQLQKDDFQGDLINFATSFSVLF